jgi:hypothetical protein
VFQWVGSRISRGGDPILALFRSGGSLAKGTYLRPWVLDEMRQDGSGTPGAIEAPVGLAKDASGNAADAGQATAASRPILRAEGRRRFLEFDGSDDSLATAAINFSGTDKATVVAALQDCSFAARGTAIAARTTPGAAIPRTYVASCRFDIAQATRETEILPRVNGIVPSLTGAGAADAGTGNLANAVLYIGRRGGSSLPLKGRIYGLLVIGRLLSDHELALAEWFMATRALTAVS